MTNIFSNCDNTIMGNSSTKDKDIKDKSKSSKDGCGQLGSGLSKTLWFDRDSGISKAQRGWLQGIAKLCNEYETVMQSAKDLLLDTASEALNPHFKAGISLVQSPDEGS